VKIRAKDVEIWAKLLHALRFLKMAPKMKVQTFFWQSSFNVVFFERVWGEIWEKILCTLKNLPAHTPMFHTARKSTHSRSTTPLLLDYESEW